MVNNGHTGDDALLLGRMKNNSSDAFNQLYERYWQQVYSAAFKRLNDADMAKDITQDIFLTLWTKRHELEIRNLPAYMFTAVRNRVLNQIEAGKKFVSIPELLLMELPSSRADQADANALKNELLLAYNALVNTMPAARQAIFRLSYEEGASTEEIALQLQISRKTVQNQLGKALAQLRASLALLMWGIAFVHLP
ncbi:RNA polymerase sigma-70 factor [uncultured Chitinophaga sp.]|uniref:RNA polymerase sigma-70 factor n=1 Tax=uncultured Chitinophaga sp. TaxID=339340 RepID=UPI0025E41BB2|nr:RNA polymerase sigma-70 factor [uncultured Chitinophaga sp.]